LKIRIIGDVHGKVSAYHRLIKNTKYSIQVGDFGFKKDWDKLKKLRVNYEKHKIIPGNHDDYDNLNLDYTFNKDYGMINFAHPEFNFFFVRGAWSIDHKYRMLGRDLWEQEEIDYKELQLTIEQYGDEKPDIIFTHDCPGDHTGISTIMFQHNWTPNRTSLALQRMWDIHHPKLWVFGHWHQDLMYNCLGTTFICLGELSHIDYEIDDVGNDVDWNIMLIRKQIKDKFNF